MCSIGEDDFGDEGGIHAMIPTNQNTDLQVDDNNGECKKCNSSGTLYKLPYREAECKDCFLNYARHKFRAALGSSKILPRNAKVVLVFDGSAESIVLLDMLHYAQEQNNYKKLHCHVEILNIDTYEMEHSTLENMEHYENHLRFIQNVFHRYKTFDGYIMPIGSKTKPILFESIDEYLKRDKTDEKSFLQGLANIRSLTSKQDFINLQKSHWISTAAHLLNCQFAFVADISTSLASDLLTAVVLGRGGAAALDVSLVDERLAHNVRLVRPIKDLTQLEVKLYMQAQGLQSVTDKQFGETNGPTASLQNLTRHFVQNLQENFSSTVSTIFRTGDKIAPNTDINNKMKNLQIRDSGEATSTACRLCRSCIDYHDSATLLAIEFSRVASETPDIINNFDEFDKKARSLVNSDNNLSKLCHACRNIVNEAENINYL